MNSLYSVYTTDDLSIENLEHFKYWDLVKAKKPDLRVIAFTIAKDIDCPEFRKWYDSHKGWVEIGVHCYDHERPQEGWRTDQREQIEKARDILKPFLPERYLYRPPGFRFLPFTERILKDLGFAGIAHQEFIKYFDTGEFFPVINTHCTLNQYVAPIGAVWNQIANS